MKEIYVKLLGIFISFIVIVLVYHYIRNILLRKLTTKECFTPRIKQIYRPLMRKINTNIETFSLSYNKDRLVTILRKWNIY